MSDLVGNPEDRFSHNEAHLRRVKNCYIGDELVRNLHTCEELVRILCRKVCEKQSTNIFAKTYKCIPCIVMCVWVERPTSILGHTETGPRFKVSGLRFEVSSEGLKKPGRELATPGLHIRVA